MSQVYYTLQRISPNMDKSTSGCAFSDETTPTVCFEIKHENNDKEGEEGVALKHRTHERLRFIDCLYMRTQSPENQIREKYTQTQKKTTNKNPNTNQNRGSRCHSSQIRSVYSLCPLSDMFEMSREEIQTTNALGQSDVYVAIMLLHGCL